MKDHQIIMQYLIASGMRQAEIARRLKRTQPWVAGVLRGDYQDIPWRQGVMLRELADEVSNATKKAA